MRSCLMIIRGTALNSLLVQEPSHRMWNLLTYVFYLGEYAGGFHNHSGPLVLTVCVSHLYKRPQCFARYTKWPPGLSHSRRSYR